MPDKHNSFSRVTEQQKTKTVAQKKTHLERGREREREKPTKTLNNAQCT